ncbi:MAG TPA: deoxyribose-phosphate aldolase, partial [Acidobacteria bacterium]|nr:deoxyribose-phosphate aldolase [Acidobacteriota bacterium]
METVDLSRLARSIDHTLLKPGAGETDIVELCRQGREWGFAAVCVNPVGVEQAARELEGSPVAVASVCGFPLGATTTAAKVFEAREALAAGAAEIDVVLDIGWALEDRWESVSHELAELARATHGEGGRLKVILECGLLDDVRKAEAARRAVARRRFQSRASAP